MKSPTLLSRFPLRLAATALILASASAATPAASGSPPASAEPTQVRYRTVEIDGQSIFYREVGSAEAPTLLLLHGADQGVLERPRRSEQGTGQCLVQERQGCIQATEDVQRERAPLPPDPRGDAMAVHQRHPEQGGYQP